MVSGTVAFAEAFVSVVEAAAVGTVAVWVCFLYCCCRMFLYGWDSAKALINQIFWRMKKSVMWNFRNRWQIYLTWEYMAYAVHLKFWCTMKSINVVANLWRKWNICSLFSFCTFPMEFFSWCGGESVTHAEHLFSSLLLFFSHGFFCKLGTHTSPSCTELLKCNLLCMIHHLWVAYSHHKKNSHHWDHQPHTSNHAQAHGQT